MCSFANSMSGVVASLTDKYKDARIGTYSTFSVLNYLHFAVVFFWDISPFEKFFVVAFADERFISERRVKI